MKNKKKVEQHERKNEKKMHSASAALLHEGGTPHSYLQLRGVTVFQEEFVVQRKAHVHRSARRRNFYLPLHGPTRRVE